MGLTGHRLLLITGTTESPGSLESLVGATTECLFSTADVTYRSGAYANRLVSWRSEEMSAYTSHPQCVSRPVLADV